jgi:hypothetical protein
VTTVVLKTPRQLGPAIDKLGRDVRRQIVRGLRKTARLGVREVTRTALTTTPRPHARGTYIRAWKVIQVQDGAVVSNTADHAAFVEAGRQPGKQPPVQVIIDWIQAKGLDKKLARKAGRSKNGRFKSMGAAALRGLAFTIARNIGRRGVRGRWVLRRAMPEIEAEALRQIQAALSRAFQGQK